MSLAAALCITVGAVMVELPLRAFTLQWRHTVEKVVWEEDYLVAGDWLYLSAARVRGSGAGMEPPPNAVKVGDAWVYLPTDRWRRTLQLARSEFGDDYLLCTTESCRPLTDWVPAPLAATTLAPCAGLQSR
jgi:hypothetical protein